MLAITSLAAAYVGIAESPDHSARTQDSAAVKQTITTTTASSSTTTTPLPTTTPVTAPSPGPPGAPTATWSNLIDGLNLDPAVVACPSVDMCVFTGGTPIPGTFGRYEQAVSVSTGPFSPGSTVTGRLTPLPTGTGHQVYVSCPSTTLCVLSTYGAIYASTSPLTGAWIQQVTIPTDDSFAGVSCPTMNFCAVVTRGGDVMVSDAPSDGPGAWTRSMVTRAGELLSISCPTSQFCVAGGIVVPGGIDGWVEVSENPGGGAAAWTGGSPPAPPSAEGPGQFAAYATCVTSSFCTASSSPLLVSTDPAAGPSAWQQVSTNFAVSPAVTWCQPGGKCAVSGVGTYDTSDAGTAVAGVPWPGVSCVTTSFCISVDATSNDQIQVGGIQD